MHCDDYYYYLNPAVCVSCELSLMSLKRVPSADPEKHSGAEDNPIRTGSDEETDIVLQDWKLLRKVDLRWVCAYNNLAMIILMIAQSSTHPHVALFAKFLGPVRASLQLALVGGVLNDVILQHEYRKRQVRS